MVMAMHTVMRTVMRTVMVFLTWAAFWWTMIFFSVDFKNAATLFLLKENPNTPLPDHVNALFNVMLLVNCVAGVVVMIRHVYSEVGLGRRLAIITVVCVILWKTWQNTFVGRLEMHLGSPDAGYLPGTYNHCRISVKLYLADDIGCGFSRALHDESKRQTFIFLATFLPIGVPLVLHDKGGAGSEKANRGWVCVIISALTSQGLVFPFDVSSASDDRWWWVLLDAFRSFLLYASLRNTVLPFVQKKHRPWLADIYGIAAPAFVVCCVLHPINPLFLFVICLWVDAEAPPKGGKEKDGSKAAKEGMGNTYNITINGHVNVLVMPNGTGTLDGGMRNENRNSGGDGVCTRSMSRRLGY